MTVATRPPRVGLRLLQARRNPAQAIEQIVRQYGEVVELRLLGQRLFLLHDPLLIERVLVTDHALFTKGRALQVAKRVLGEGLLTSEGELHRRQRRLIQPAFHRQRLERAADAMVARTARWAARWEDGTILELEAELRRLTIAIVGETLFGAEVEETADQVSAALTQLMATFDLVTLPFADLLDHLPVGPARTWRAARAQLDAIITRLLRSRPQPGERDDLLDLLLSAVASGAMSEPQARDEALTIFLAGHETTANALAWTWYLLAQHPEVEAALQEELDTVLGGRLPTAADVPRLVFTRQVLAEAMRLYPPAWAIGRRATVDYPLGEVTAPAGSIILMSQWVLHRDPRYWPDPLRFDPSRFAPGAPADRPRFSYFPFGGGPRLCLGEGFAWLEATLVLATIAQRWQLRLVPGHPVEVLPVVTLRPRYGVRMVLQARPG
ncbi:MAG: cytochrome P450 [Dehalococcoidia bacterium]|nr:MAG: cytochrome P450 [Dehalococcoidia bacterium]